MMNPQSRIIIDEYSGIEGEGTGVCVDAVIAVEDGDEVGTVVCVGVLVGVAVEVGVGIGVGVGGVKVWRDEGFDTDDVTPRLSVTIAAIEYDPALLGE